MSELVRRGHRMPMQTVDILVVPTASCRRSPPRKARLGERGHYGPTTGAALCRLQLDWLRLTLPHAYANPPYYRRRFGEAGVTPGDLRGIGDLARFPFTTKADLRAT